MTIKQTQCLLNYLGYDTGGVDGVNGAKTRAALASVKAKYGVDETGLVGVLAGTVPELQTSGTFWDACPHFTRAEFKCKCGGKYCNGYPVEPEEKLVRLLEDIRDHFGGKAVTVSSGIRCEVHNRNEGGVEGSRHTKGWAADIGISGVNSSDVVSYAYSKGAAYSYAISDNYAHVDVVV